MRRNGSLAKNMCVNAVQEDRRPETTDYRIVLRRRVSLGGPLWSVARSP